MSTPQVHPPSPPPPPPPPSRLSLLRLVAPAVPALLYKSAGHLLSLTPQSAYWDLRTTLTVEFLRSYLGRGAGATVEAIQATTLRPLAVAANTWKADVDVPAGSSAEEQRALEEMVRGVVGELAEGGAEVAGVLPWVGVGAATGEWVGSRTVVEGEGEEGGREGWSEERKYECMMEEVEGGEDSGVVLWLHGGAYWLCDPATHRPLARKVAKSFKGRVFLPRYRLAPQNPFPAALLDALSAYLYLLYPPPGALHRPIPASRITLAGDSAGGNLSFSLLQLLLHLHRRSTPPEVTWHGAPRALPLPAGVAAASPWVDVSRCFGERFAHADGTAGSEEACSAFDYLPTPREERARKYKPSPAWPADVGRSHFYTADALVTHPLVSPITAASWAGAPPVWVSVGDECLRDAALYFAHRLLESGVPLQMMHFTAMPHVFQTTVPHLPVARRSFEYLAGFVRGEGAPRAGVVRVHPVTMEETVLERAEVPMGGLGAEEVRALMEGEVREWAKRSEGGETARL